MSQLTIEYSGDRAVIETIKNAVNREIELLKIAIDRTKEHLKQFEERYNISSKEFFEKMESGDMDDRDDFVDWSGEYELLLNLIKELEELDGVTIY